MRKQSNNRLKSNIHTYFLILFTCFSFSSCAIVPHHSAPKETYETATTKGFDESIRFWSDVAPNSLAEMIQTRVKQYKEAYSKDGVTPDMNYLALSGGAKNGAFASGIINGWSTQGNRPEFAIVSGVSTGALLAPFAFLGEDYNKHAKRVFTTVNSDDIFKRSFFNILNGFLGGTSIADSTPLKEMIEEEITADIFQKIAEEHNKGRRLFIGTTNLEAQRGVIWNIGALANSGNPKALNLFHQILRASSAIPGAFQPVMIDVIINGKPYQELHVDGAVTSQVFIYPSQFKSNVVPVFEEANIKRNIYIIHNAKINTEFEKTSPRFLGIMNRSLQTLIKYHGIGDLNKLYLISERDKLNFNLHYIPKTFTETAEEEFDPVYMRKLFNYGYTLGKKGKNWHKTPPGIEHTDNTPSH